MNPTNNHEVRAKVVTIRNTGSARWVVEFEGVVTRRDILRINRILKVEFARAQRRYSLNRKKLINDAHTAELKKVVEIEKTSVVSKSDETTVTSKLPKDMTPLKKVNIKETVKNG